MKNGKFICGIILLVCSLMLTPVTAVENTGSLRVSGIEQPVYLYRVLHEDDSLAKPFENAGLSVKSLEDERSAANNAKVLKEYVRSQNLEGQELVPGITEDVLYTNLEEGLYLVCSEEEEFVPFLVWVPTEIGGKTLCDIQAEPKSGGGTEPPGGGDTPPPGGDDPNPPEEGEPIVPGDTPKTDIPQTGVNVWPKYLLLAFGGLCTLVGMFELLRSREEEV